MAQKVIVTLVDDIDGTEAVETVKWSLDGVDYEIDLSDDNVQKLRGRLKEFKQYSRVVKHKRSTRSTTPPIAPRPSDDDTAAIREWAVDKKLLEPGKRGRISNSIKQAYTASLAGDDGPLNELRAIVRAFGPAEPVKQLDHSAATAAVTAAEAKAPTKPRADADDASTDEENPEEAEARRHYTPLTVHDTIEGDLADSKTWKNRSASGIERTTKVEQWTLVERIEALNDGNLAILGAFLGVSGKRKGDGTISGLKTSAGRLQNLEMIRYAPDTADGWEITDFGRYAHKVRSMA